MSAEYFCVIERSDGFSKPEYWKGGDIQDFGPNPEEALKLVDKGDAIRLLYNLKPWPLGCRVAEIDHRPRAASYEVGKRLGWVILLDGEDAWPGSLILWSTEAHAEQEIEEKGGSISTQSRLSVQPVYLRKNS